MISSMGGSGLPLSVKVLRLDLGLPEECTDTEEIERSLCWVPGLLRAAAGFEGWKERQGVLLMTDKRTIRRTLHTVTLLLQKRFSEKVLCFINVFLSFDSIFLVSQTFQPIREQAYARAFHWLARPFSLFGSFCRFERKHNLLIASKPEWC